MAGVRIEFGGYQPPTSVHSRAAEVLGRALADRLGDSVDFSLTGNVIDQGRNAADLLDLVARGEMTMCYFSSSYLAELAPEIALLDLPFSITDRDRGYALLDGPFGALLRERLEHATDYRLLAFWDNGFRHLSNRARPIHTPEDCRGLRIRTLFSKVHQETFAALGFQPVPLDVKELISGVREGTIDAQDNPLTNIYNFGIHEFHPHITLSAHFFGVAVLLCHKLTYDAWPTEVTDAMAEAVAEATAAQRGFATAEDADIGARLTEAGVVPVALTEDERAAFVASVAPVVDRHRARFDAQTLDLLR